MLWLVETYTLLLRPLLKGRPNCEIWARGRHFDFTDVNDTPKIARAPAVLFQVATDLVVERERSTIEDLAVQFVHADLDQLPEAEDVLLLLLTFYYDISGERGAL